MTWPCAKLKKKCFLHEKIKFRYEMSLDMRFPTMWYVRPAKPQISLRVRTVWSEPLLVAWVFYDCSTTDWTPFRVSKLKRRLQRLVRVYTCQKATLLEISCTGSNILPPALHPWWLSYLWQCWLLCRTIFFCGEVVTTALFERCLKILPEVQFINLYSVSECHDVANENLNDYFRDNKVTVFGP